MFLPKVDLAESCALERFNFVSVLAAAGKSHHTGQSSSAVVSLMAEKPLRL